jgi:MFS family permease
VNDAATSTATAAASATAHDPLQHSRRNFLVVSWYQIVLRIGWIFKTESVIIPAALDSLGASGWMRGCLPVLNRFGQSIPPLLAWPGVKRARRQQLWLAISTAVMAIASAALAAIWLGGWHTEQPVSARWIFLAVYGVFFISVGISQLALSSLIGKLIPARRRGLLMLVSNTRGAALSIGLAWLLLSQWMREGKAEFVAILAVAAACFFGATAISFLIVEPPAEVGPVPSRLRVRAILDGVWQIWVNDPAYRRILVISGLFGMSMSLFPHYQNLARTRLGAGFDDMLPWLLAQNAGVALFSIPAGWLADRFGNRLVLRIILPSLAAAPLLALWFSQLSQGGRNGFIVVYFLLGLTPVTMRLLSNFSLEFASPPDHPRYLAAQTLATALPVMASSVVLGRILDLYGHELVYGVVVACLLAAWILSFSMAEPRRQSPAIMAGGQPE